MLKFSKFDTIFGHNNNWTFNPFRRTVKNSNEPIESSERDSTTSESDKRKNSNESEPNSKRVSKYNCPTEPFRETLRLIDELF